MKRLVEILAVVLTCGAIALSADLFRMAGLSLYTEQFLAGLLAIATPLGLSGSPRRHISRSATPPCPSSPRSSPGTACWPRAR
jgi:hypothetical protein